MSALQFLLLEANLTDVEVVQATLREGGIDCELLRVDTRAAFIRALESNAIDLILADYALSNFDEIAALTIARRLRPEIPFIFISGSLGEELAIAAIKQGATDYVLKQRLGRLVPSVQEALQEVPELDKDTTKRKQALSVIELDLKDTQLLHELSARLVTEGDIQTLYQEIIAAAIALTQADAGSIQILDEATQELVMLANQGATPEMMQHFHRVNASSNTSCGIALTTGDRTFVDFDVPESEDPHGSMRLHVEAGYLSAQSTPLITRSGKVIGMFSTHWREHHRPTERELRFLDLLSRQAADLIEHCLAKAAIAADLRETQRLHKLSTYLVSEDNIQVLYDEIVAAAVDLMQADAGTIQILEEEAQYILLLASLGLEQKTVEYFYRLDASSNTTCGFALATRKRAMINYDVPASVDPDGSLQKLVEAGFLCGQSTPLITRSGRAIGMVSTHWGKHHRPTERELRFLDLLARQAADLIEQRQAQVALRESEERLQAVANLVPDLLWDSEPNGSTNWYNQRWMEYTGQTFEQAIAWGWIDVIHPDDRAASDRRYHEAVEQGVSLQQEHRIRRHDGEYRWFVVNAFPLKDESGKVIKMYGAATDIHQARISLEALRESEEKYRSLFNSIDEGFCLFEIISDETPKAVDYRFLEVNPVFEQQTGLENVVGKLGSEIAPNTESYWLEACGGTKWFRMLILQRV